jgi:hypothetical protein
MPTPRQVQADRIATLESENASLTNKVVLFVCTQQLVAALALSVVW